MASLLTERIVTSAIGTMCQQQIDFLTCQDQWAVACCGKQAGKNYTVTRLMLIVASDRPKSNVIYVNSTYREARAIMWADPIDGLPAVAKELGLKFELNESRLEMTFSNGSSITLMGADRGAWEKLLGQKIDLLVADELQKMNDAGLETAIRQTLPDRFAARRGMFRGIGTPNEFCVGVFHDISTFAVEKIETDSQTDAEDSDGPKESVGNLLYPAFKVFKWTAQDLDGITPVWQEQLRWKEENQISDDDPIWKRDKLGLWVPQNDKLIFPLYEQSFWDGDLPRLIPSRNGSPVPRRLAPIVSMGLDFGFTDATAATIGHSSPEEGVLRVTKSCKQRGLDNEQMFDWVKSLIEEEKVDRVYADSSEAGAIALFQRKGLPVYAVNKKGKTPWIQDMRGQLRNGRIKILRDDPLHDELKTLAPDPKQLLLKKIEPVAGSEDHCFDAFRYLYMGIWEHSIKAPLAPMSAEEEQEAIVTQMRQRALSPSKADHRPRPHRRY